MSESLTISGTKFVLASVVSEQFGYTREYVLMLARDGKIEGEKIDNKWYVNPISAETFFTQNKEAKKNRSESLSKTRKEELTRHRQVEDRTTTHTVAILETLTILVIGLTIGVTGYLGATATGQYANVSDSESDSFFERIAVLVYSFFSFADENHATNVVMIEETKEQNIPSDSEEYARENEVRESVLNMSDGSHTENSENSLIVAPQSTMTTTTVESIRNSFSDDVTISVDPLDPNTGIITPHFKEKDGESYRYLMVPVNLEIHE